MNKPCFIEEEIGYGAPKDWLKVPQVVVRAARIQSQWVGLQSLAGPVCFLLHPQCWWQDLGWASTGGRRQLCWCMVLLPSWSSRMKQNYSLDHFSMPTSSPVPWDFLLFLVSLGSLPSSQTPFWSCSVFFPRLTLLPLSLPSCFSPHYPPRCCSSKVRPSGAALPVPHGCAFRMLYVHACYVASVLSDSL